jgi:hypothetical protein
MWFQLQFETLWTHPKLSAAVNIQLVWRTISEKHGTTRASMSWLSPVSSQYKCCKVFWLTNSALLNFPCDSRNRESLSILCR